MNKLTLIVLLSVPCLVWGQKKEIETTAKITEVTVYTSAAEVNYEKEITLQKGKSTIVFTDLTPFIAENSVNVSISNSAVNIITVAERINYAKERRNINEQVINLQDSIVKLNKEFGLIKCKRDAAETEKGLLFKGESIGGLSTNGVAVSEIEKASTFFSKRYLELAKELLFLNEKENELNTRITKYKNQISGISFKNFFSILTF